MSEQTFEIGQIFSPEYPPEAAVWCNERGDCYIIELDHVDGQRRFQIVPVPAPTLEEVKQWKLSQLEEAFLRWYEQEATVTSSMGFVADSDARAMMDVSGLVTTLEATPAQSREAVAFMDHNNEPQMLTLEQMKTLQLEIIQNGQSAYAQKWALRMAIEQAQDVQVLESLTISFHGEDFSAAS